jgi:hypothetical protein
MNKTQNSKKKEANHRRESSSYSPPETFITQALDNKSKPIARHKIIKKPSPPTLQCSTTDHIACTTTHNNTSQNQQK